jgi:uncharacterized protein YbjQ (UPF0145 family)
MKPESAVAPELNSETAAIAALNHVRAMLHWAAEQRVKNFNRQKSRKNFMQHSMTTTAFNLDGFRVTKTFGVVRGITVRSRSIFGTIGGALQTLVGGNITLFTELCEKTRAEAFEMMITHATELGANAMIGIRYDANEVMDGVTEVLCYGTAVLVEPV